MKHILLVTALKCSKNKQFKQIENGVGKDWQTFKVCCYSLEKCHLFPNQNMKAFEVSSYIILYIIINKNLNLSDLLNILLN